MKNLNLRSSQFGNYAFGLYTPRKEMLELDLQGSEPTIPRHMRKYVVFGSKHEKHGIAKWCMVNKKIPQHVLKEQHSFKIQNWLNLKQEETISISSTPDGIYKDLDTDKTTILEVKCSNLGKSCKDSFDKRWLPQVFGQQFLLACLGYEVKETHLINWSKCRTKIYQVKYCQEFINYLIELLEEYSLALLKGKANGLIEKPKEFNGNIDDYIKKIYDNGNDNKDKIKSTKE